MLHDIYSEGTILPLAFNNFAPDRRIEVVQPLGRSGRVVGETGQVNELNVEILAQPDETTCGPTCLDAIYRYYGDPVPLPTIIDEVPQLETGGTLAVLLACHALGRGYKATIYTYNLRIFDPTWFGRARVDLDAKLREQARHKPSAKLQFATDSYLRFLDLGGLIRFEELNSGLLRRFLRRGIPILTGLSATYLYRCPRELDDAIHADDVRGEPSGHFVVLCGYDRLRRVVRVADPYPEQTLGESNKYCVGMDRLIGAILLGIMTYDANLLIIEPRDDGSRGPAENGARLTNP